MLKVFEKSKVSVMQYNLGNVYNEKFSKIDFPTDAPLREIKRIK